MLSTFKQAWRQGGEMLPTAEPFRNAITAPKNDWRKILLREQTCLCFRTVRVLPYPWRERAQSEEVWADRDQLQTACTSRRHRLLEWPTLGGWDRINIWLSIGGFLMGDRESHLPREQLSASCIQHPARSIHLWVSGLHLTRRSSTYETTLDILFEVSLSTSCHEHL